MRNCIVFLVLELVLACMLGCGPQEEERGDNSGPLPGSCLDGAGGDICGQKSLEGCYCDDLCEQYKDCCSDKKEICDTPAPTPTPVVIPKSCENHCGEKSPGGCWCDELCTHYGDCCEDLEDQCSSPTPEPTPTPQPSPSPTPDIFPEPDDCFACHINAHYPDEHCTGCHEDG